jgi:hypothetical protein
MNRVLALATAWFAASVALGLLVVVTSAQNPAVALAYGWTGVVGAGAYACVVRVLDRRSRRRGFDEELAAHYLSTPATVVHPEASRIVRAEEHEGLRRLHRDIAEDERH